MRRESEDKRYCKRVWNGDECWVGEIPCFLTPILDVREEFIYTFAHTHIRLSLFTTWEVANLHPRAALCCVYLTVIALAHRDQPLLVKSNLIYTVCWNLPACADSHVDSRRTGLEQNLPPRLLNKSRLNKTERKNLFHTQWLNESKLEQP